MFRQTALVDFKLILLDMNCLDAALCIKSFSVTYVTVHQGTKLSENSTKLYLLLLPVREQKENKSYF